jgi:hypothetical protein
LHWAGGYRINTRRLVVFLYESPAWLSDDMAIVCAPNLSLRFKPGDDTESTACYGEYISGARAIRYLALHA